MLSKKTAFFLCFIVLLTSTKCFAQFGSITGIPTYDNVTVNATLSTDSIYVQGQQPVNIYTGDVIDPEPKWIFVDDVYSNISADSTGTAGMLINFVNPTGSLQPWTLPDSAKQGVVLKVANKAISTGDMDIKLPGGIDTIVQLKPGDQAEILFEIVWHLFTTIQHPTNGGFSTKTYVDNQDFTYSMSATSYANTKYSQAVSYTNTTVADTAAALRASLGGSGWALSGEPIIPDDNGFYIMPSDTTGYNSHVSTGRMVVSRTIPSNGTFYLHWNAADDTLLTVPASSFTQLKFQIHAGNSETSYWLMQEKYLAFTRNSSGTYALKTNTTTHNYGTPSQLVFTPTVASDGVYVACSSTVNYPFQFVCVVDYICTVLK